MSYLAVWFVTVQYVLCLAMSGSIIFTVQYELFLASYVWQDRLLFGGMSYFWQHRLCCHALGAISGRVNCCCVV